MTLYSFVQVHAKLLRARNMLLFTILPYVELKCYDRFAEATMRGQLTMLRYVTLKCCNRFAGA